MQKKKKTKNIVGKKFYYIFFNLNCCVFLEDKNRIKNKE